MTNNLRIMQSQSAGDLIAMQGSGQYSSKSETAHQYHSSTFHPALAEGKATQRKQRFDTIRTLFNTQLAAIVSGKSQQSNSSESLMKLIDEICGDKDYILQLSTTQQILQEEMGKIELQKVYASGEDRFFLIMDYFFKNLKNTSNFEKAPSAKNVLRVLEMCSDERIPDDFCQRFTSRYRFKILEFRSNNYEILDTLETINRPSMQRILKKTLLRQEIDPIPVMDKALHLISGLPATSEELEKNFKYWRESFRWGSANYARHNLSKKLPTAAEELLEKGLSNQFPIPIKNFQEIVKSIDRLKAIVTNQGTDFTANFLYKIADQMQVNSKDADFLAWGTAFLHEKIYTIPDETAIQLYTLLKKIPSLPDSLEGAELLHRLAKLPEMRIPKIFIWIWRGSELRIDSIRQMLKFHEMNPEHRLVVYTDDAENFWSAADQVAANASNDDRALSQVIIEKVSKLKQKVEIKTHNILATEKIRTLLKNEKLHSFSRLDAIASRNGNRTAVAPLYAVVADIERLAVLFEEGGIYVDHNCICIAPIHENARAEAGLAGEITTNLADKLYIQNNSILAAPENSQAIKLLLQEINETFDYQDKDETAQNEPITGTESMRHRYRHFLTYPHHIPEKQKLDAAATPLMWSIGRFSNQSMLSNSRLDIVVRTTGPRMLSRVMEQYWQVAQLNDIQTKRLYLQAGGLFLVPAIQKPDAPGNWTRNADAPAFSMDDAREREARQQARKFRPYTD